MKCMNCGAELTASAYCPKCGCDVSVQKQAIVLSGLYYNQGLEKAQVRDLSGAIDQLMRSNVMDVATRQVVSIDIDTPVERVCAILGERRIKKAPVLQGGKLVGTVSRADVTRGLMASFLEKKPTDA